MSKSSSGNMQMIRTLMFRLLPVQVLLAVVGSINNIVSTYFASNYVGIDAMSAVGLYAPVSMLLGALSTILCGGSAILCGKYLGQNEHEKLQNIFSLDIAASTAIAALSAAVLVFLSLFDLTGFFTRDPVVRPIFNIYLLGQTIGILPLIIGNQLPAFLAAENRNRRTLAASIVYIIVNLIFNILFVQILHLEAFGIALSSSLGMWIFMAVQAGYFFSGKSLMKFSFRNMNFKECGPLFKIGFPGAATNLYQTLRGLAVNHLLEIFVGTVGISAFAAANNFMGFFWSIPAGMIAVSRLLISVSVGEEDRQTLTDIIRVMFRRFIPLMLAIDALIIAFAPLLTRLFFKDPSMPVFRMTTDGFRILPLCMPFSIICMHLTCYAQASGKQALIHLTAFLDGFVCVAGFSWLLIRSLGINGVYLANVLNGIVITGCFAAYAWIKKKHFPRNADDLLVIPDDFGVPEKDRIDVSIRTLEEVSRLSQKVQDFCLEKGLDARRSYLAGLAMEEMAGNVVSHGFTKDKKKHSVDIRVACKNGKAILRIKDDCVPFDPKERRALTENADVTKNIGIRMIYKIMEDIQYQNMLGLNVLTIRI
ncbi:MAG: ATP-binding protein [Lachnospiraceae bacterium]|nr:ATP-binding protein [Lachnospiraceae bacterium]